MVFSLDNNIENPGIFFGYVVPSFFNSPGNWEVYLEASRLMLPCLTLFPYNNQ